MSLPAGSSATSAVGVPPDLTDKLKLAEVSFKTVLDADVHQDNKASRILGAMAFLTAAAAGIFARAYPASPLPTPINIPLLGTDVRLTAFVGYILFVLIGAALYLAALGPSLNIPDWLRGNTSSQPGRSEQGQRVLSLLFFNAIGSLDATTWEQHWAQLSPADLQQELLNSYIREARLIAQKAQAKVGWMSVGSICFRIALAFLAVLLGGLFGDRQIIVPIVCLSLGGLFLAFYFEVRQRPSSGHGGWALIWVVLSIACLIGLLLSLFGVL